MDDIRSLTRRALANLPSPLGRGLRNAKRAVLNMRSPERVFGQIANANGWNGTESISGPGSTMHSTSSLRAALPSILREYQVHTLLDIPCGDAYWIGDLLSHCDNELAYIGADIVSKLIERNRREKSHLGRFEVLDLVSGELPNADMVIVRDCLIHLPNRMVQKALANVRRSGARYLLTTSYPDRAENVDIEVGGFRPIDLQRAPFSLPAPIRVIPETDGFISGKCMALWEASQL